MPITARWYELKQTFFGEAHDLISSDNGVVEQSHVELPEHFFEALSDELIRMRRLGHLAGMCVDCHHRGGVLATVRLPPQSVHEPATVDVQNDARHIRREI